MFLTINVFLGGKLTVEHGGKKREYYFGEDHGSYDINCVGFYADCQHQVLPVEEG